MKIVWDEPKRQANIAKHAMDFDALTSDVFDAAVIVPAKKGRSAAVGHLNGVVSPSFSFGSALRQSRSSPCAHPR